MTEPPKNDALVRSTLPAPVHPLQQASNAALGISVPRKVAALAIALVSDAISVGTTFVPPAQIVVDLVTAALLFAVLGRRWPLLPVLIVEAIPGVAMFPTWVLVVGMIVGFTPTTQRPPSA